MAYSKATAVKYVKAVGTYDESELAEAIARIDDSEAKLLYNLTRKVYQQLKAIRIEVVEGKKSETKRQKQTMSQHEKLHCTIQKIELALEKYEATDEVDSWDIGFTVGEYYGNKTFEQLRIIHDKLISTGTSVEKLRLLNFVERGGLYDFIKNSDERRSRSLFRKPLFRQSLCSARRKDVRVRVRVRVSVRVRVRDLRNSDCRNSGCRNFH